MALLESLQTLRAQGCSPAFTSALESLATAAPDLMQTFLPLLVQELQGRAAQARVVCGVEGVGS